MSNNRVEYHYCEDKITIYLPTEKNGLLDIETLHQAVTILLSYLPPDIPRIRVTFVLEDAFYQVLEPLYKSDTSEEVHR